MLKTYKDENPTRTSIPKSDFPQLLKKALLALNSIEINKKIIPNRIAHNLKSGFPAAGISPFDPEHVLKRLCDKGSSNVTSSGE